MALNLNELRNELMHSKATHNFTFTRNEMLELLGLIEKAEGKKLVRVGFATIRLNQVIHLQLTDPTPTENIQLGYQCVDVYLCLDTDNLYVNALL
jgi:hypothetical protein